MQSSPKPVPCSILRHNLSPFLDNGSAFSLSFLTSVGSKINVVTADYLTVLISPTSLLTTMSLEQPEALAARTSNCMTSSRRFTSQGSVCHPFWLALRACPTRTAASTRHQKRLVVRGGCIPSSSRNSVTSSPTRRPCMRSGSRSGPTATFRPTRLSR